MIPDHVYHSVGEPFGYKVLLILLLLSLLGTLFVYLNNKHSKSETPKSDVGMFTSSASSLFQDLPTIKDKTLFLDTPTLLEIRSKIAEQPPYTQDEFSKSYIGIRVHWILSLDFIITHDDTSVVSISFNDRVDGAIDVKEFPEVKIAKTNARFEVWAEITDIIYPKISLGIHDIKAIQ
jgi:hypothetical protein